MLDAKKSSKRNKTTIEKDREGFSRIFTTPRKAHNRKVFFASGI